MITEEYGNSKNLTSYAGNDHLRMLVDMYVCSDGITTVRFVDRESYLNYAYETGWPAQDTFIVRHVAYLIDGILVIQNWDHEMDPEFGEGTWDENVYIPSCSASFWPAREPEDYSAKAQELGISYREAAFLAD